MRIFGECHDCIPFETKFRTDDELVVDFRIWIGDLGFKVFCRFNYWIERSDTANPKSEIKNLKWIITGVILN